MSKDFWVGSFGTYGVRRAVRKKINSTIHLSHLAFSDGSAKHGSEGDLFASSNSLRVESASGGGNDLGGDEDSCAKSLELNGLEAGERLGKKMSKK
jgi:hypothetical protein